MANCANNSCSLTTLRRSLAFSSGVTMLTCTGAYMFCWVASSGCSSVTATSSETDVTSVLTSPSIIASGRVFNHITCSGVSSDSDAACKTSLLWACHSSLNMTLRSAFSFNSGSRLCCHNDKKPSKILCRSSKLKAVFSATSLALSINS